MKPLAFLLSLLFFFPSISNAETAYVRNQEPVFLTFDELQRLSSNPFPGRKLGQKLKKFWITPIINNEAYYRGTRSLNRQDPALGPYMRVASWNIEKSLHIDKAIQVLRGTPERFSSMIDFEKAPRGSQAFREMVRQRERLRDVDILILQEMEIGIKRSQYWNAASELAKAMDMNYAYGAQYLEVDPVILGLEQLQFEGGEIDQEAMDYYKVDPEKYKGVFGSAVLSKYPIKHVEVRPLKTQPYDWYWKEKDKISFLEKARRFGAKSIFKNELTREMKVGGRHYFRVDLDVPDLPEGTLTIINIHLEIKCQPKDREAQMKEILSYIKGIRNPVIMMGDFNAAPTDISPTTVGRVAKRTAKNPTTWLGVAVNAVSPHGLAINTSRGVSNVTKNFNDPFARDIKVVAPNPLKKMFEAIREFRFEDGTYFDFRGNANRSIGGKDKLLSNSNERGRKGFKTTFKTRRTIGNLIGKLRLDWAFVKSYVKGNSENATSPYRFAPHFGETLEEMNTGLKEQVSDHHPNVIDLPFKDPKIADVIV